MKKVVIFCDYFGNGGIEQVITNIKDNIDKNKYDVSLLTTIYNSQKNCECFRMSKRKITNPIYRFLVTIFNIRSYTKDSDIVHINLHNSIDLLYACLIDKHKRVIVHAHNSNFQKDRFYIRKVINNIFKFLFNRKRFIYVACSDRAGYFCFGKKVNYQIIRNDFNGKRFLYNKTKRIEIRKKYNISDKTFVIGHIGRFVEQKNHYFLINIFKEFNKLVPDSLLFMIGDGKLKNNIVDLIADYGLQENVIIINYTNQIEEYYQLFDAFVFPSVFEGYGMCIYEALCSSLMCFVSEPVSYNFEKNSMLISIPLELNAKFWAQKIYENMRYRRKHKSINDNFINDIGKLYGSVKEKISIIVPAYNSEDTIEKCISSILNQTYKNLELIIINDGSTDNTSKILKSFKDKRIKIINQKNHGTGYSRNVGIKNSTGDYLTFVDSDDTITEDCLDILYNTIIVTSSDISCSSVFKSHKESIIVWDKISAFDELLKLPETIGVGVTRKLFKRHIIEDLLFDEYNYFEDISFSINAFLRVNKVSYIDKQLYICNYRDNSRSSYYEGDDRIRSCLDSYDIIKNQYPSLFNKYIIYSLFNMIGVANMMIINNKYDEAILDQIKFYIAKYIKYVSKTNYPLYKKNQIYLFHYNYNLYKKVYIKLRRINKSD